MLYKQDGTPEDPNRITTNAPISKEQEAAITAEYKAALLTYNNRHGDSPFAVCHILGGRNSDWNAEGLASSALYHAYFAETQDHETACHKAGMAAGRIFWQVLMESSTDFQVDHTEKDSKGISRTFYRRR